MYNLIRNHVKLSQSTWQIYGWDVEMKLLETLYKQKKLAFIDNDIASIPYPSTL